MNSPLWYEIMGNLTGPRLRIWDNANRARCYLPTTKEEIDAANWLIANHLAEWHEIPGAIRAVPIAQAKERLERDGPRRVEIPAGPTERPRPRVHTHQAELFA